MENTEKKVETETVDNVNEGFDFKEIRNKAILELKKWPNILTDILKNPHTATAVLPTKGDWAIPAIYGAAAGALMGVVSAARFFQISLGAGIGALISGIFAGAIGVFIGGVVLNAILMSVGKDPGVYRTIFLVSILSIFSLAGSLGSIFMPFAGTLGSLGYLYVMYFYCQSCAGFTKKQAQILIGSLLALTVLPFLGAFGLFI